MCEEGGGPPLNASRAERLRALAGALGVDGVLLITGWDGCYNLDSKGLVEWLCDLGPTPNADFRAAALEEGVFVAMPQELAWFVEQDGDGAADDAVSALDQLFNQADAGGPQPMDIADGDPDGAPAASAAAPDAGQQQQQQQQPAADGKLSLLLQLHPRLRRVGVALGVEVRGGVQQQVPADSIYRWPLLMALAEQLQLPMEQLFERVVDITPSLRALLGGVDGAHLHATLRVRRPLLTRAWLEALGTCGRRTTAPKLDLTEAAMAAAVTEFVSGCGCRLKPGQYQPLALPPRVLLGQRTSQPEALSCPNTSLRSQAAKQGSAVLHATLEAADACSPLRVARTIFFGQGAGAADTPLQQLLQGALQQPAVAQCGSPQGADGSGQQQQLQQQQHQEDVRRCNSGAANNAAGGGSGASCCCPAAGEQQQQQEQQQQEQVLPLGRALAGGDYEVDHQDLFDLMCWYWAAVDAAWQCMEHYATQPGATWPASQALGTQVFWQSAAAAQLLPQQPQMLQQSQQQPHVSLQLLSWDGGPRPMPCGLHLEQHNLRFKTLRVVVSGIASRSPAHPGLQLGSVLYMDTFVDVPAMGELPAQLINATLTHCPTYSFNFWGSEAYSNTQLVAAFRRHLQLQLQAQAQAVAEAQARAALRTPVDDASLLRLQLQQELRSSAGAPSSAAAAAAAGGSISPVGVTKAGAQRRNSLGQQQQLLLLQQLAAAGSSGGGSRASQQQQQQQLLLQLQQQQLNQAHKQQAKASKAGSSRNGTVQQQQQPVSGSGKHSLVTACCGDEGSACREEDSSSRQAQKRSCCGDGQQQLTPPLSPQAAFPPLDPASDTAAAAAAMAPSSGREGSNKQGMGAPVDPALARQLPQLGRLLLPPGEIPGEVGLVFTGAMKLAVMDGPLYPHSNGFVFVSRPTKVHVVLLDEIAAVWLQDFASQIPGYPNLGPCVVLQGRRPCCGLLPATHMTDNVHVAISLRAMSKACSQHWVTAVLPAWNAAAGVVKASKGAAAPWPLPPMLAPFFGYWLQGPRKRFMLPQPDDVLDRCMQLLDRPSAARRAEPQPH